MTKLLMKVFNARQMVGKFAKGAMLAACFGMMMSVAGVASADAEGNRVYAGKNYTNNKTTGNNIIVTTDEESFDDNTFFNVALAPDVSVEKTLTVTGTTTLNSTLTVKGNTTLGDAATDTTTVNGTLDAKNNISVGGTLGVKGNTTLGDAATDTTTVNGTLDAKNNISVGGTLGVTGKATFSGGIDAGGKKIENVAAGDITSASSTDAVNGGQLYTALQGKVDAGTAEGTKALAVGADATASGNYSIAQGYKATAVGDYSIAQGVKANATKDQAVAIGNYAKAEGTFAVAIGGNAKALQEGTTAVGPGATADGVEGVALGRDTRVLQGATNSVALGFGSVATESDVVSVGVGDYTGEGWNENAPKTRKIVNVQAGTDDNDAATVGQIKAVDGTYVKEGQTVAENFTALDSAIGTWEAGNYIKTYTGNDDKVEKNNKMSEGDDASGSSSVGSVGENLMALDKGLTEEVNRAQKAEKELQDAIDTEKAERINADKELRNEINQTNDRVDRVGATAAALAAINYQPMSKGQSQVAIGMGGYKGKKATAIGMAYQITDRVSGSVAGAANGSEHMFNVGFNYLFGQHSNKDVAQCAAAPGSMSLTEAELRAENKAQNDQIQAMQAEIAELKAMLKALTEK